MAAQTASSKIFSRDKIEMFDHDPDGTSAAIVTPDAGTTEQIADMRDYENFAVVAMSSALTGAGISLLEIVASETSDFSGQTIIVKSSGAVVGDAVGDYVALECTAGEVVQAGVDNSTAVDARYVAGRLTVVNAADEAVVTYIRSGARHCEDGLTATTISEIVKNRG
jgi:hypothetical protein